MKAIAICVVLVSCIPALYAGEDQIELILGVDLATLFSDYAKGDFLCKNRRLGDIPPRVLHDITVGGIEAKIGVSVYPDATKAIAAFNQEVSLVSVGGLADNSVGNESVVWEKRLSFRRSNVCVCIWTANKEDCLGLARFLDEALKKKSPKGASVPIPEVHIVMKSDAAVGFVAQIEVKDKTPVLLVDTHTAEVTQITTLSVLVAHPDRPLLMATRSNVLFEAKLPALPDQRK